MNEVIFETVRTQDPSFVDKMPSQFLTSPEQDCLNYLKGYIDSYNTLPDMPTFLAKFPASTVFEIKTKTPLAAVYDEWLERKRRFVLSNMLVEAASSLQSGLAVDLNPILALASYNPKASHFSIKDNDESLYIRRSGSSLQMPLGDINKAFGGLGENEYFVISGRPGNYKTFLALQLANAWAKEGKRVFLASQEMSVADMTARIWAINGEYNAALLRRYNDLDASQKALVATGKDKTALISGDIIFPSSMIVSPSDLLSQASFIKPDVIIIDSAHLLLPDGQEKQSSDKANWLEIKSVSNALNRISKQHGFPIVATVQLKRSTAKNPTLDDIAFSDAIGQDADFVVGSQVTERKPNAMELELTVMKNRYGNANFKVVASADFEKSSFSVGGTIYS